MTPAFPPVPLERLAGVVAGSKIRGVADVSVVDVAFDSREVQPGSLFFCIPGLRTDGHRFAAAALSAGAAAFVVERWLDVEEPQVLVASVRGAMGPMSSIAFGGPAASMTTVGVTGTNGKTTVTHLMESIFVAAGWTAGIVGTTGARLAGEPIPQSRTTPEAPDLQRTLALMRDRDVRGVAVEVSSHALAQHRVDGIVFDVAVLTNLSQDHLDFHGSMDAYSAAKARLFTSDHARRAAVNVDDPFGRTLLGATIPVSTYAIDRDADVRARQVVATIDGITLSANGLELRSELRGSFNGGNVLAAMSAARLLGIGDDAIAKGVAALHRVPGRMEAVEAGQDFLVVVDYAHTPIASEACSARRAR